MGKALTLLAMSALLCAGCGEDEGHRVGFLSVTVEAVSDCESTYGVEVCGGQYHSRFRGICPPYPWFDRVAPGARRVGVETDLAMTEIGLLLQLDHADDELAGDYNRAYVLDLAGKQSIESAFDSTRLLYSVDSQGRVSDLDQDSLIASGDDYLVFSYRDTGGEEPGVTEEHRFAPVRPIEAYAKSSGACCAMAGAGTRGWAVGAVLLALWWLGRRRLWA